jgi:hypothetical protein
VSPAANFALASVMWILAGVLATGRDERVRSARKSRKATADGEKEPPKWQQRLGKGTARTTFVVGGLLSLPGATYLVALNSLHKLDYPTGVTVLVVIFFNLIQMLLIEVPMVALKVAPSQTPVLIENAKDWARIHGRGLATWGLLVLGLLFAIRGLIEIL